MLFEIMGRYPSGQRGQTVNLLHLCFRGSNPLLPMNLTEEFRNSSIINEICDLEVLEFRRSECVVAVGELL